MPNHPDLSVVDPLVCAVGTIPGFISSRLMAAYKLDHDHVLSVGRVSYHDGRVRWHYVLEHNDATVFEGSDFESSDDTTYGEAARGLLGFLTLRPGDVDSEHFDGYTPKQLEWRDAYAEELSLFALDPEDDQ